MSGDLRAAVARRAADRGLALEADVVERLGVYLDVLGFWNRRVNLTSCDLNQINNEAIDRLVLESVEAAALVRRSDVAGVDIGSGGGSPGVPLMICCPWLSLTLVEVRERKGAFLREVLRQLELPGRVETVRAEELELASPVSLITMRAVRADRGILDAVARLLQLDGRFLWFGAPADAAILRPSWVEVERLGTTAVFRR